ncbi:MAG TPA: Ser-Thr-rich GPI-anchored membrane family protein [Longimicrobium sp.]
MKLSRTRGLRLAVLGAAAGMVLASTQRGQASEDALAFQVLTPGAGWSLVAGSTVMVTWTSTGSSNVNLYLVDVAAWAVADVIAANTADDGAESYTIPATMPAGQYLVYVENVGVTDWTYGDTFDILACGSQRMQQQSPRRPLDRSRPLPPMPRPDAGGRPAPKG